VSGLADEEGKRSHVLVELGELELREVNVGMGRVLLLMLKVKQHEFGEVAQDNIARSFVLTT